MTITEPRTARASSVAAVLRPEVWSAVEDLDSREEVRDVLGYFLEEAAHEAQTVQAARSLLRAVDLLVSDLLYLERLVEALRAAHAPTLQDEARDSLRAARARRARVEEEPDNVVRVDFGRRAS